jgi:hypothetical protein
METLSAPLITFNTENNMKNTAFNLIHSADETALLQRIHDNTERSEYREHHNIWNTIEEALMCCDSVDEWYVSDAEAARIVEMLRPDGPDNGPLFAQLRAAALQSARSEAWTWNAARPAYDADDAAQDAMAVLLEQLQDGRDDDAPAEPFVRRVAKNRIRTAGRTSARRRAAQRAVWERRTAAESGAYAAERALAGAPAHLLRIARLTQAQNRAELAGDSTYWADLRWSEARGLLREHAEQRGYAAAPSFEPQPLMPAPDAPQEDWKPAPEPVVTQCEPYRSPEPAQLPPLQDDGRDWTAWAAEHCA